MGACGVQADFVDNNQITMRVFKYPISGLSVDAIQVVDLNELYSAL